MNNIANNIKQRLSMREPLCEALDVVVQITDRLTLNKSPEEIDAASVFLKEELAKVSELFSGKYSPKKQRKATEVKTFGNKTDKAVLR